MGAIPAIQAARRLIVLACVIVLAIPGVAVAQSVRPSIYDHDAELSITDLLTNAGTLTIQGRFCPHWLGLPSGSGG
jgi:hypothetical protein